MKESNEVRFGEINRQASELFNGLPDEDRRKAGLGYSLAQHTTIVQMRIRNKEAAEQHDRKLAEWQKNVEQSIMREYLVNTTPKESNDER